MKTEPEQTFERYIAIDGHKYYVVVGGINDQLEHILPQRRMSLDKFRRWAPGHLYPTDAVVIEASTNILRLRSGQALGPV